jgi:hypothetical protein
MTTFLLQLGVSLRLAMFNHLKLSISLLFLQRIIFLPHHAAHIPTKDHLLLAVPLRKELLYRNSGLIIEMAQQ